LAWDGGVRQRVIAQQRRRLADFSPASTAEHLRQYVEQMVAL
jgi:hypothetical protein